MFVSYSVKLWADLPLDVSHLFLLFVLEQE